MTNSTYSPSDLKISFGTRSQVDTGALLNRDGWMCVYCGRWLTLDDMTVDHVTPTLRGGADSLDNTAICCRECNTRKGDMTLLEYRHWLAVRRYAFVIAPDEPIIYEPVEILVGKGRKQTSTIITLPALWADVDLLRDEWIDEWEAHGAIVVRMHRQEQLQDVAFLHGVLYDYYALKRADEG